MEEKKKGKGGVIALLLVLFLLCAGAGIYGYLNKDKNNDVKETNKSVEKIEDQEEKEQEQENNVVEDNNQETNQQLLNDSYEQIDNFNNDGVYENLSFLLDGTIQQRHINNRSTIKDAVNINGNILDIDEYKAEFAFQYGFFKKYANYLGEEYTMETGSYSLPRNDIESVCEKVYGKGCSIDDTLFSDKCYGDYLEQENLCLNDKSIKYYNSGIFTGYTEDDYYRFVEVKNEKNGETIKTIANIYNTISECNDESEQSDEDYCNNHAKKIGRIELEYKIDNNNYIFKTIGLFDK